MFSASALIRPGAKPLVLYETGGLQHGNIASIARLGYIVTYFDNGQGLLEIRGTQSSVVSIDGDDPGGASLRVSGRDVALWVERLVVTHGFCGLRSVNPSGSLDGRFESLEVFGRQHHRVTYRNCSFPQQVQRVMDEMRAPFRTYILKAFGKL